MALRSDSSSTLQEAAAATPGAQWQAADVRRLQLHSSRLVTGIFAGAYRSAFRGRGIEFEEVREYQPGDDVRSIDWNVTARAGRPYLKQFVEERDLTVLLLLDRSASLACPTPRGPRSRVAAEACALLALAAARSNDRVGLLTCTDRIERYLPRPRGRARPGTSSRNCSRGSRPGWPPTWPAPCATWTGSAGAPARSASSPTSSAPISGSRWPPRPGATTLWRLS
jgi:uncharacterized protein (DUF58 family)